MSTTSGARSCGERSGGANTVPSVLLGFLFLFAIVDFAFLYLPAATTAKATVDADPGFLAAAKILVRRGSGDGQIELALQELESTRVNIDTYVKALEQRG